VKRKKVPSFEEYVARTVRIGKDVTRRLQRISEFREDLESDIYRGSLEKLYLISKCKKLEETLGLFLRGGSHDEGSNQRSLSCKD